MHRSTRFWSCLSGHALSLLALLMVEGTARADDADVCIEAAESGQKLNQAGKLLDARKKLAVCRASKCPEVVRGDCERWATRLEASTPSVVFRVVSGGADVPNPTIEVDGVVAPLRPGRALQIDPGNHDIRARAPGYKSTPLVVTAREGETNRIVSISLTPEPPANPGTLLPRPDLQGATSSGPPVTSFVLWGVASLGVITTAAFGIAAQSAHADLETQCGAPVAHCSPSDVSTGRTYATISDIGLGVAVAFAAAGVVVWLVTPNAKTTASLARPLSVTF